MSPAPQPSPPCDNCARVCGADELDAVRRVYLDLDEGNQIRDKMVLDEVESWCASCRSMYPHEAAAS